PEGFLLTRARAEAEQRIESLQGLLSEFTDETQVNRLHEAAVTAGQAVAVATRERERVRGLRQEAEAELLQRRESSADAYYATFEPRRNCPLPQCPFNPGNWTNGTADPEREHRIAELVAVLARHDRQIAELDEQLPTFQEQHADAETRYVQERRQREQNID